MIRSSLERPNTNDYFSFYGLQPRFDIDLVQLKSLYLDKSKQYHPDFYTDDPEAQNIALSVSAYNNLAYKTLVQDIGRAQYLVDINTHGEGEKQNLPDAFLMEMMDLNEAIDLLNADDIENKQKLIEQVVVLKSETQVTLRTFAIASDWQSAQMEILKWKYLTRLEWRLGPDNSGQ